MEFRGLIGVLIIGSVLSASQTYANKSESKSGDRDRLRTAGGNATAIDPIRVEVEKLGSEYTSQRKDQIVSRIEKNIDASDRLGFAQAIGKASDKGTKDSVLKLLERAETDSTSEVRSSLTFVSNIGKSQSKDSNSSEVQQRLLLMSEKIPDYIKEGRELEGDVVGTEGILATSWKDFVNKVNTSGQRVGDGLQANDALAMAIRLLGKQRVEELLKCKI